MTVAGIGTSRRSLAATVPGQALCWAALLAFAAVCLSLKARFPWLVNFPAGWTLPLADWINLIANATLPLLQPAFRALSTALEWPMRDVRSALIWLPWPAIMLFAAALALRGGGGRLAIFVILALAYMLGSGYWLQSMSTLSLVLLAVPMSTLAGFAIGAFAWKRQRFRPALSAILDLMQTVPAFAYLIPLLLLFGFGPVVGLIASAIYATPPMVRNTMLGLDRVPPDIHDSGIMSGCTRWQQFWHVNFPSALPQILIGFNQTTMAALSMVIIAAIIGGFEDIGWEVLSSMRKAEFGQSMMSGLVIALLAIMIDRLMLGFARERPGGPTPLMRWMNNKRLLTALVLAAAMILLLRLVWPEASFLPQSGLRAYAAEVNQALIALVREYGWLFNDIRNSALYSLFLPLRLGISGSAIPAIWGFSLTPAMSLAYGALISSFAALAWWRLNWQIAVAVLSIGLLLYVGFAGLPWPILILSVSFLAWQLAGPGLALFAASGFGLILLSGMWAPLTQSLYLTVLAVGLCLLIGGALGLWAAHNERVSRILRPICDALQTMPQFVFLIPALMLFKVGEFTALIAIMLYAVVPPIRYVEHGLRHVQQDVVDAVRQMGATPVQTLFQAKLPLAMPVIMLGLNQTVMATLAMLAIAALVGTRDLGQQVYVALGKADAGMGLVAGLSIAFLAILADRMIQASVGARNVEIGRS